MPARHESNVLWAALCPDPPAEIELPLAGNCEHAAELFLRFVPRNLGRLFPRKTARRAGDASKRARATRLSSAKVGWRWCTPSGNTTVVPNGVVVADFNGCEGRIDSSTATADALLAIESSRDSADPLLAAGLARWREIPDDQREPAKRKTGLS